MNPVYTWDSLKKQPAKSAAGIQTHTKKNGGQYKVTPKVQFPSTKRNNTINVNPALQHSNKKYLSIFSSLFSEPCPQAQTRWSQQGLRTGKVPGFWASSLNFRAPCSESTTAHAALGLKPRKTGLHVELEVLQQQQALLPHRTLTLLTNKEKTWQYKLQLRTSTFSQIIRNASNLLVSEEKNPC